MRVTIKYRCEACGRKWRRHADARRATGRSFQRTIVVPKRAGTCKCARVAGDKHVQLGCN